MRDRDFQAKILGIERAAASFDANSVIQAVENVCKQSKAPEWMGVAEKLRRVMHWEFEDYQELDEGDG